MRTLRSRSIIITEAPPSSGKNNTRTKIRTAAIDGASASPKIPSPLFPASASASASVHDSTTEKNEDVAAASPVNPVTPAGERELSAPLPKPQSSGGPSRRNSKTVEKKLQFTEEREGVVLRSRTRTSSRCAGADSVSCTVKAAAAAGGGVAGSKMAADKGKRKMVEEVAYDSEDDGEEKTGRTICLDSSEEESELPDLNLTLAPPRSAGGSRNKSRSRNRSKGETLPGVVIEPAGVNDAEDDGVDQAQGAGGNRVYERRGNRPSNAAEVTKERFRAIARKRAAHFAHFAGGEEATVPVADVDRSVEEQRSRASRLLADVSAEAGARAGRADDGEKEQWPGPFALARQLVEGRAAAASARQESAALAGEKSTTSLVWEPSRKLDFKQEARHPPSLHDMCVDVLCANIDHVETLDGIPDTTKKCLSRRLCAKRNMTAAALRLYLESKPTEVDIPDCTAVTEQELTEAIACCATEQIEMLDLGLCGRCLSDQLCVSTLGKSASSLAGLHSISLKGAYRLTDTGLIAILNASPKLITLNLNQCSMISASGIQAAADLIGPQLRGLNLDFCSQLDAFKLLPSLVKMTGLESLVLSGILGMTDAIMSELVVKLGSNLRELYIAECKAITDESIRAISLCCPELRLLDLSNNSLLTDEAMVALADGCRSLKTLRLNRGKFSDTAVAAYITASGNCLSEFSLNNVRLTGESTLKALSEHCSGTLMQLDLSFCRAVSDQALGLMADCCQALREVRIFGCTQVTALFLYGHSNSLLKVVGWPGPS